jgi:hypothetical protein
MLAVLAFVLGMCGAPLIEQGSTGTNAQRLSLVKESAAAQTIVIVPTTAEEDRRFFDWFDSLDTGEKVLVTIAVVFVLILLGLCGVSVLLL